MGQADRTFLESVIGDYVAFRKLDVAVTGRYSLHTFGCHTQQLNEALTPRFISPHTDAVAKSRDLDTATNAASLPKRYAVSTQPKIADR